MAPTRRPAGSAPARRRCAGAPTHSVRFAETREAEAQRPRLGIALAESAKDLRTHVLLGLRLDGIDRPFVLHKEVDLAARVLGRPIERSEPRRHELLAHVLLGQRALELRVDPTALKHRLGRKAAHRPQEPHIDEEHLETCPSYCDKTQKQGRVFVAFHVFKLQDTSTRLSKTVWG